MHLNILSKLIVRNCDMENSKIALPIGTTLDRFINNLQHLHEHNIEEISQLLRDYKVYEYRRSSCPGAEYALSAYSCLFIKNIFLF